MPANLNDLIFLKSGKSQRLLKEREANGKLGHLNEFKKNFDSTNLLCMNEGQRGEDSDSELNDLDDELDKRSSILSNEEHLTISNAINSFKSENVKPEQQPGKLISPSPLHLGNNLNSSSLMSNLAHSANPMMNPNSNSNLVMRLEMNQIANAAVAHALKNNLLTNKSISLANSQLPMTPLISSTAATSNTSPVLSSSLSGQAMGNKMNDKNLRKMDIPSLIDNMKNGSSAANLQPAVTANSTPLLSNPFIASPFMPKFNHPFDALWKQQSNQNFLSLRYPLINSSMGSEG